MLKRSQTQGQFPIIPNYTPKQQEQQESSKQQQSLASVIPTRCGPPEKSSASSRGDPTMLLNRAAARHSNKRPIVNSMNRLNRLFTPGSYFSPPCSRIGLAFCPFSSSASTTASASPSLIPALALHSASSPNARRSSLLSATRSQGHGQVNADPNFQQQRQRTFSNVSGILLQQPQQSQQRSGSSSFFYPILNLLVATSTAVAAVIASSSTSTPTSKGSEDDLPSPIYCSSTTDTTNKDSHGNDKRITTDSSACEKDPITAPVVNRSYSWNLMTHSQPELHAMTSEHHFKKTLPPCMNGGSHPDKQSSMDSPLLDLQEKEYVLTATGSTSAHMLESKENDRNQ
ncbi:hypothetical protein BGZ50_004025 [Haplosporangium sp. Z 11]|nr:hypothetical protein BGZ50_004025 [Haplosporangium sp. Z 11]